MSLYEHWNQCQLKTKTPFNSFIHWREDRWLLLKASVNGCNSHRKYTSVVYTGKCCVSTVELCVWDCCSRLDCLVSPHAASDYTERKILCSIPFSVVMLNERSNRCVKFVCKCIQLKSKPHDHSLNEGVHFSTFTG